MTSLRIVTRDELRPGDQYLSGGIRVQVLDISDRPDAAGNLKLWLCLVDEPDHKLEGPHLVKPGEMFELVEPRPIKGQLDDEEDIAYGF